MFLMSRKIKAMGIKMVLSGEGADEIFAGYLYFHKCPNPEEMQAELKDKIRSDNLNFKLMLLETICNTQLLLYRALFELSIICFHV